MAASILIIDDEEGIRLSLRGILEDEGYEVDEAATAEEGLKRAEIAPPDMIFLDIWLPGMDGLEALDILKLRYPEVPVVMISGHGNIETAVDALRRGAHDFIEKPLSLEKILLLAQHSLEMGALRRENRALRAAMEQKEEQDEQIVGKSPAMLDFRRDLEHVAPTDAWVLITGENGTGKEVAARAVYRNSLRADKPFVAVNCAAIPEELIESELFGHEKGAFTGADSAKAGKFELADKGTLFLDEIGDMSLKTQARILRILQEQCFERVGGTQTIKVDVRVIAATNKNLEEAIENGEFRADLYYRLRVFPLCLPPLRERSEDIPLLLAAFAARMNRRGLRAPLFAPDAVEVLKRWPWPGNVRELGHLMERMSILHPDSIIGASDLPPEMRDTLDGEELSASGASANAPVECPEPVGGDMQRFLAPDMDFKSARAAFENWYLEAKLEEAGGNITRLSELVGLERSYLHRKLKAGRH